MDDAAQQPDSESPTQARRQSTRPDDAQLGLDTDHVTERQTGETAGAHVDDRPDAATASGSAEQALEQAVIASGGRPVDGGPDDSDVEGPNSA